MFRKILLTTMFALLGTSLYSEDKDHFYDRFTSIEKAWINEYTDWSMPISKLEEMIKELQLVEDNGDKYYKLSLLSLLKGQIWLELEDKNQSLKALENAMLMVTKSMELKITADLWRIKSEAGSYIMLQKGLSYIIGNSAKIQDYAVKALELDPENARAILIVAQGLINAPPLFGGNKKEGIFMLEKSVKEGILNDIDFFYFNRALSMVYTNDKRINEAIRAYRMILSLFPENKKIQKSLKDLL